MKKLRAITPADTQSFYKTTIHAFSLIECSPALISKLLTSLSLDLDEADAIYVGLPQPHLTTQHFAEHLSRALQKRGMTIIHPTKLERMICGFTGRPTTFVLGSLNWAAKGPESNSISLEIALEPVTEQLVYLEREEEEPKSLLDPADFTQFDIYLPKPGLTL